MRPSGVAVWLLEFEPIAVGRANAFYCFVPAADPAGDVAPFVFFPRITRYSASAAWSLGKWPRRRVDHGTLPWLGDSEVRHHPDMTLEPVSSHQPEAAPATTLLSLMRTPSYTPSRRRADRGPRSTISSAAGLG
jgi:hypothetical protein